MLLLENVHDVEVVMVSYLLCTQHSGLYSAYLLNRLQDGKDAYEKVKEAMELGDHFHIIFMDIQVGILSHAPTALARH